MHCSEKIVFAQLHTGFASAEKMGQGEICGVTRRVLCMHMVASRFGCKGAMVGLDNASLTPGGSFLGGKAIWVLNEYLVAENTDYCMLDEWAWLK